MKVLIAAIRSILCLISVLGILAGCAPLYDVVPPPIEPEPAYDVLYPYYVEICAVSQIRARFAEHGGSPGHAVMYIKGACRNPETEYPTLKLCDPQKVDLRDPESGVGISVNKVLKNVNWLAIPGQQLFFYGNLKDGQLLNEAHARATIEMADNLGIFNGVQIHEMYFPEEDSREALILLAAKQTMGTDFALNFGRTGYCVRLPVTREMQQRIIDYLNRLNIEYATGEGDYNWSGYYDNCSHTLRNSLAAAGIWKPKSVRTYKLRQLFHLSIPANEFANLAILSTSFPIENFDRIYRNEVMRQSLLEDNWLPTRHGALLRLIPVHQDNALYDTRVRIFVLEGPFKSKSKKVEKLYFDWRYTGVAANLRFFKQRYQKILDQRPQNWNQVKREDNRSKVQLRYYRYIEQQLADVNAKLARLYPHYRHFHQP